MAKKGMSERQYAAHAGMSRGAIQKAKQSGRLVMHRELAIWDGEQTSRLIGQSHVCQNRTPLAQFPVQQSQNQSGCKSDRR